MWMEDSKCVVLLTFDFDAESLWISRDPSNWDRNGTLSMGTYGARVGVPRILELLEEENLKATFFVPGWVAEHHTDKVEAIRDADHEIGLHGYLHEWVDPADPAREKAVLDRGFKAIVDSVGVTPRGYRAPSGETSFNVARLLKEMGFLYDSSMLDDVFPYRMTLTDQSPGIIEIPWSWSLDDAVYALYSARQYRAIFTNSHILEIWKAEFDAIYRWGGVFNLLMHPQVIGRPSRLDLLRDFIAYARSFPGVRFERADTLAEWYEQHEPPFVPAKIPRRPADIP